MKTEGKSFVETATLSDALADLVEERSRQDEKWGTVSERGSLTLSDLVAILAEETGEVAEACLEARFGDGEIEAIREEAIQVAALGVFIVQWLDFHGPDPMRCEKCGLPLRDHPIDVDTPAAGGQFYCAGPPPQERETLPPWIEERLPDGTLVAKPGKSKPPLSKRRQP